MFPLFHSLAFRNLLLATTTKLIGVMNLSNNKGYKSWYIYCSSYTQLKKKTQRKLLELHQIYDRSTADYWPLMIRP